MFGVKKIVKEVLLELSKQVDSHIVQLPLLLGANGQKILLRDDFE